MKFTIGLWIPGSGRYKPLGDDSLDFDRLKEQAQAADRYGFDSIWVSDHLVNPMSVIERSVEDRPVFESWTTLSALSTLTSKVRLGNLVLCNPFRYPGLLAKMAATLDVISKGRFILGIGAGWFRREAESYGIPWAPYPERLASLEEAIKVIKKLWLEEEANFEGKYYRLKNAKLHPKPIQKPHPPILIGGGSDKILRLVAKEGDAFDFDIWDRRLVNLKERVRYLRDYCQSLGRKPEEIEVSASAFAFPMRNREEAMKLALSYVRPLGNSIEEFADPHLIGSPKDIIEKLEKYVGVGVHNLKILFVNGLEGIELFADEVLPEISEAKSG